MHGGFRQRSSPSSATAGEGESGSARAPSTWRERAVSRAFAWTIDIGLVTAAIAAVVTRDVVLWFHVIFVLVVVAALELPFRQFALRLTFWSFVSSGLVIWSVHDLETPRQELTELPILTFVLVLVFLVAQSRARGLERLRQSQRDIEARAVLERDTMRTQLEESQRLDVLGRASAKTAHEMRTVLTIVRGCAAELGEEPSPTMQRKADELLAAVDRGLEMLDELLAAGRANRAPIGTLDLRQSLRQAEVLLAHLVPDGVIMRCSAQLDPLEVDLNRTSFTQIVMNLVANSVDAVGDRGSISVAVREVHRHRATAAPGLERCAVITVTDNGPGMTVPEHGDVFDPGFTTKGGAHSGLGLSMVWQIAARAGGTVEIDSNPGAGTTVSVFLPLAYGTNPPKRCVLGMVDERARALISHEFDRLGYEVHNTDEIDPMDELDAEFAVLDVDHRNESTDGARIMRVFQLDVHGPWRLPATSSEAADLVRRILMAGAASTN